MDLESLFELRERTQRAGVLICFAGPLSHSIIEELGAALRRHLEETQLTRASLLDVFSVFIEQTQNVRNYAKRKTAEGNQDHDFASGIIVIAREADRYVVSSGNMVAREDIAGAIQTLQTLRSLDKPALRAVYKERLRQASNGGPGGGLGLIDMARRASQPLEYALRVIDDRYCFFSLKATI